MAKLVLLSEGFTGRTHELITDKTTIGRVEDNTFQIADASVSSHHCEVNRQGEIVLIKDLNSTNGTFIDGNQVTNEAPLKHGQIIRLGQIQLRFESAGGVTLPTTTSAPASAATPTPSSGAMPKRTMDQTMVMEKRGGVSLNDLEAGPRGAGFETSSKGFSKKSNKTNLYFIIGAIVLGLIIISGIVYALMSVNK